MKSGNRKITAPKLLDPRESCIDRGRRGNLGARYLQGTVVAAFVDLPKESEKLGPGTKRRSIVSGKGPASARRRSNRPVTA